jgi:hypothetical protein
MRNVARIGMLGSAIAFGSIAALGVAVLGVVALGAAADAGADSGAPYTVKATGTALKITVAGTSLVGGTSSSSAGQGAAATAEGVGELTPAVVSDQQATAPSANASQSLTRQCAQPTSPFPAPVGSLVDLGIGCSTATASQDGNGLPTASASGSIASFTVGAPTSALPIPVDPGSALATTLEGVLGNVPLPALPSTGLPLGTVLVDVAAAANSSVSALVDATVGASTSSVTATATTATATTQVQGTQIGVLKGLGASGGPLLTVVAGKATTTTSLDRSTAQVTATDTPGVVTVTVSPPAGAAQTVTVAPGQSQTFLAGTPLQTTVAVGAGSATSGSGKGSATASGLTIDAVQGLGAGSTGTDGGLDVQIASAASTATGTAPAVATAAAPVTPPTAAVVPAAAPAPAVPGVTTVHTGEFWSGPLPIALLGLALLTGLGLVARRRLAGLAHLVTNFTATNAKFARRHAAGDLPPGPATGTSSVPPPVSGPARRQTR